MKIPISKRLLCCAAMVPQGARVADIGCDHGYLGIWLLTEGIADHVAACDLREKPLEKAKQNGAAYGTADRMEFHVAGHEFGLLVEGDRGILSFQGTRYLGFERKWTCDTE